MPAVIGIDPGMEGAIAVLDPARYERIQIFDVPSVKMTGGRRLDYDALWEALWLALNNDVALTVIEDVNGFSGNQKNTASSAGKLMETKGALQAFVTSQRVARHLVAPSVWKKSAGVRGKGDDGKNQARLEAKRRWPECAHLFNRVKDHNRAEAALIADYGLTKILGYVP